MLNKLNIESVKSKVSNHLMSYMPCMIKYKSSIQREILSLLTYSDTCDIRDCRFNTEVVEKLVALGKSIMLVRTKRTKRFIVYVWL